MKKFNRFSALFLVIAILFLCSCSKVGQDSEETPKPSTEQVKYNTPAGMVTKNETVYVNLDNSGKVTQTIVSDWLHTTKGQVYVDDVTNLSQIENIKDDSVPDVNGRNLRWYMDNTDLYYQGKTNAPLPLQFKITYALNGMPISATDLVGKSGHVQITIKMINTKNEVVKVNGKDTVMYTPMVVVGGTALNESKFQNISVSNGKTISNGNNQFAVMVGFPGINESLGLTDITQNANTEMQYSFNDTFVLSADVAEFEIGNFMFAALPIASLDLGLNSISTSMDDVRENLSKLNNVQKVLQDIDADRLLSTLTSNPNKISELSDLVGRAAKLYAENKALIDFLNNFATPQNMQTIQVLTDYISNADLEGIEETLAVLNSIFGDEASAAKIQEGLDLLKRMSDELNDPEVQKAIDNLPQTVATLNELQKAIDDNRDVIDALQVLADSNALASIDSAVSSLEGSFAIGSISQFATITGDADEITAKMTAWIELGKRYTIFTTKASNMDSSVMFIYKVDGLKSSIANNTEKNGEPEVESSSGLGSLFKKFFGD